jgi:hypothetical protein
MIFWDPPSHLSIQSPPTVTVELSRSTLAFLKLDRPQLRVVHVRQAYARAPEFGIFEHLQELIATDKLHGLISSYVHDDDDRMLFITLFLSQYTFLESRPEADKLLDLPLGFDTLEYDDTSGNPMQDVSYRRPVAVWQVYTSFKDKVVPLEILARMREAEGVMEKEWRGRGVQVGDEAWSILTQWYEDTTADAEGDSGDGE